MQHASIQYGQGATNSHHPSTQFTPPEAAPATANTTTTSLRAWRKKDATNDKTSPNDHQPPGPVSESQTTIARVAPHTHYPRPPADVFRYPQYGEYGMQYKDTSPASVKYPEIVENAPLQRIEHLAQGIQKPPKEKEYLEMCSIQQAHIKTYPDHLNYKTYNDSAIKHQYPTGPVQPYLPADPQLHTYMQKDPHMHQYMQKDAQFSPYIQKFNMQSQYTRNYPEPSNILAHLKKIDPQMAQAIINDPHLREPQIPPYMDQNRIYQQAQRGYRPMHTSPTYNSRNIPQNFNPGYNFNMKHNMPPMPPRDPYQIQQYQHNMPKYPHDLRDISPRRGYPENVQYVPMPSKLSPNYNQCSQLEYAQHYRHRRPQLPLDYYEPQNKPTYMPNHMGVQESSSTKSNALKQYFESWNEEELNGNLSEMTVAANRVDLEKYPVIKGAIRFKADGPNEQQLYVLDSQEISSENITQYLHLQQVEKITERGIYPDGNINMPAQQVIMDNFGMEADNQNAQMDIQNKPERTTEAIIRSYGYGPNTTERNMVGEDFIHCNGALNLKHKEPNLPPCEFMDENKRDHHIGSNTVFSNHEHREPCLDQIKITPIKPQSINDASPVECRAKSVPEQSNHEFQSCEVRSKSVPETSALQYVPTTQNSSLTVPENTPNLKDNVDENDSQNSSSPNHTETKVYPSVPSLTSPEFSEEETNQNTEDSAIENLIGTKKISTKRASVISERCEPENNVLNLSADALLETGKSLDSNHEPPQKLGENDEHSLIDELEHCILESSEDKPVCEEESALKTIEEDINRITNSALESIVMNEESKSVQESLKLPSETNEDTKEIPEAHEENPVVDCENKESNLTEHLEINTEEALNLSLEHFSNHGDALVEESAKNKVDEESSGDKPANFGLEHTSVIKYSSLLEESTEKSHVVEKPGLEDPLLKDKDAGNQQEPQIEQDVDGGACNLKIAPLDDLSTFEESIPMHVIKKIADDPKESLKLSIKKSLLKNSNGFKTKTSRRSLKFKIYKNKFTRVKIDYPNVYSDDSNDSKEDFNGTSEEAVDFLHSENAVDSFREASSSSLSDDDHESMDDNDKSFDAILKDSTQEATAINGKEMESPKREAFQNNLEENLDKKCSNIDETEHPTRSDSINSRECNNNIESSSCIEEDCNEDSIRNTATQIVPEGTLEDNLPDEDINGETKDNSSIGLLPVDNIDDKHEDSEILPEQNDGNHFHETKIDDDPNIGNNVEENGEPTNDNNLPMDESTSSSSSSSDCSSCSSSEISKSEEQEPTSCLNIPTKELFKAVKRTDPLKKILWGLRNKIKKKYKRRASLKLIAEKTFKCFKRRQQRLKQLSIENEENVEYRNLLKLGDTSVLIEIGGEIIELSVLYKDNKKMISVTPISNVALIMNQYKGENLEEATPDSEYLTPDSSRSSISISEKTGEGVQGICNTPDVEEYATVVSPSIITQESEHELSPSLVEIEPNSNKIEAMVCEEGTTLHDDEVMECNVATIECSSETIECTTVSNEGNSKTIECTAETINSNGETNECSTETIECNTETIECSTETIECSPQTIECSTEIIECTDETIDYKPKTPDNSTEAFVCEAEAVETEIIRCESETIDYEANNCIDETIACNTETIATYVEEAEYIHEATVESIAKSNETVEVENGIVEFQSDSTTEEILEHDQEIIPSEVILEASEIDLSIDVQNEEIIESTCEEEVISNVQVPVDEMVEDNFEEQVPKPVQYESLSEKQKIRSFPDEEYENPCSKTQVFDEVVAENFANNVQKQLAKLIDKEARIILTKIPQGLKFPVRIVNGRITQITPELDRPEPKKLTSSKIERLKTRFSEKYKTHKKSKKQVKFSGLENQKEKTNVEKNNCVPKEKLDHANGAKENNGKINKLILVRQNDKYSKKRIKLKNETVNEKNPPKEALKKVQKLEEPKEKNVKKDQTGEIKKPLGKQSVKKKIENLKPAVTIKDNSTNTVNKITIKQNRNIDVKSVSKYRNSGGILKQQKPPTVQAIFSTKLKDPRLTKKEEVTNSVIRKSSIIKTGTNVKKEEKCVRFVDEVGSSNKINSAIDTAKLRENHIRTPAQKKQYSHQKESSKVKLLENSNRRRLSLEEYNNRKRKYSCTESETVSVDIASVRPQSEDVLPVNEAVEEKKQSPLDEAPRLEKVVARISQNEPLEAVIAHLEENIEKEKASIKKIIEESNFVINTEPAETENESKELVREPSPQKPSICKEEVLPMKGYNTIPEPQPLKCYNTKEYDEEKARNEVIKNYNTAVEPPLPSLQVLPEKTQDLTSNLLQVGFLKRTYSSGCTENFIRTNYETATTLNSKSKDLFDITNLKNTLIPEFSSKSHLSSNPAESPIKKADLERERVKELVDSIKLDFTKFGKAPRRFNPENETFIQPKVNPNPCSNISVDRKILESKILIRKLCNKEVLTPLELAKVHQIIKYKRAVEHGKRNEPKRFDFDLSNVRIPPSATSTGDSEGLYEIKSREEAIREERDSNENLKMQFRDVLDERPRKRKRFRNLYANSDTEDDFMMHESPSIFSDRVSGDFRDPRLHRELYGKDSSDNYSVFQENNREGLPKLIIKRRASEPKPLQPVVKITRCSAVDTMAKRK